MMTTAQMLRFFGDSATMVGNALLKARDSGNFHLAAQNARQLFKYRLMAGLLSWRLGNDPRLALEEAVRSLLEARGILLDMKSTAELEHGLPLPSVSLVAYLVDLSPAFPPEVMEPGKEDPYELALDWRLVSALRGSIDGAELERQIAALAARKRCALAAQTYRTYFRILAVAESDSGPDGFVREAEVNYKKRARDPFYSSGQTEGGGPDNPFMVDYRLGAILKKVGFGGESVHRWRW